MATVQIQALSKTYPGNVTAVSDVDIAINDGEFVVLVGPSGCGKSTILRMVAGLETITAGELKIDDIRVNDHEPGERNIAMVFQNYALYPHMSVRGNMAYGLKNEGLPKDQIEARIQEAATTLRLSEYLDRKPRQLSGGQRQRVAMGRAIVREPKVFLFDEPLSNLDAKLRTQLRAELKALHQRLGATFIYVTHDQVEAMSLADRIVIMNQGRIEQVGAPMDLYLHPETLFVADFIGSPSMNFIDAHPTADRRGIQLSDQVTMPLPAPLLGDSTDVTLGIRPEHLHIDPNGPLRLSITFAEQLGADTIVHGTLLGSDTALALRLEGVQISESGAQLALNAAPEQMHIFDRATGKRLDWGQP